MQTDLSLSDATLERLPPQSIEAEQAVLGSVLVNPEALSKIIDQVEPEHFYRKAHQVIYAAIRDLFDKTEPIDIVTVSQYLKDQGKLDSVGGRPYLTDLAMSIATTANVEYYAKSVSEKALMRNLIKAGTEIVQTCYEEIDADIALDKAERLVFGLAEKRGMASLVPIASIVNESFARIEARYEQRDALSGVPSGFYDLDEMTSGWQRSDLIIIAARPSMGKCLVYDSQIVLPDGSIATIEQLYKQQKASLLTLGNDFRFSWTEPSAFVDDGVKPAFKVITRLGRSIETTITHPFLSATGWKQLEDLKVGDHVAVPRKIDVQGTVRMRECEIKILAYLIGDGCLSNGKIGFTNTNPILQADFAEAVKAFGGVDVRLESRADRAPTAFIRSDSEFIAEHRANFGIALRRVVGERELSGQVLAGQLSVAPGTISHWCSGKTVPYDASLFTALCTELGIDGAELLQDEGLASISRNRKNPIALWLEAQGLLGSTAHEKILPSPIFTLPKEQLALFLNRLFATDGWATKLASGQPQLGYSTVSEKLAGQIQHLLLRFGIIARLRRREVKYRQERRTAWQLDVTDADSIRAFADQIGIFSKEQALANAVGALQNRRRQTNCDLIPAEVWATIDHFKADESWASLSERAFGWRSTNMHVGKRALSRRRLSLIASALKNDYLHNLAASEIYWDEIVSIEYAGMKQVYDLTIPETHNFVANDVCVHNTALVLNLAQNAAVEHKAPVAIFSLEMSKEQLVQRLLCAEARIDANKLRSGFLQTNDWTSLADAMGRLGEAPIYIDDSPALSALDVRAKCRRLKAEMKDLGLVIIDYIQLMQGRKATDNRVQEVAEISRGLKQMARELNTPVIALSQLSRAVESRQNKRPMLSDLRESGSIEQDADIVMFIYRDEYYNPESEKRGEAELIIAKQRNGPVGTVELLYQSSITRFLNKTNLNYGG